MSGAAGGDDVEIVALWLGEFPEAYNLTWMNDEQTTNIMIDVDVLAKAILASSWLADRLRAERAEGAREALDWLRPFTVEIGHRGYRVVDYGEIETAKARAAAHATQDPT